MINTKQKEESEGAITLRAQASLEELVLVLLGYLSGHS